MRILHVSEVAWGGVVSLLREFAALQVASGHEVGLLAPAPFPALDGIRQSEWLLQRRRPLTYAAALNQLRRTVADFEPDVVHLHSFVAGFLGRLPMVICAGVPVVYQPHAWAFDLPESTGLRRTLELWERLAARHTDALVTNCQDEVDEGRRSGVRTEAFPIGVTLDVERFHVVTHEAHQGYRAKLGVSAERMLLCIGRIARQKGQDQLVAAWEASPIPEAELVLVGPGDTAALQAMAPTQWGVTIRAVGEDPDVRPWLWASDALVLPSRYETVAVVVAEAMSCGRPVVATEVNGVREVIEEGPMTSAGRVVPLGDMEAMLAQSRRVLEDAALRREMSLAGRARAVHLFRQQAVADRLEGAYLRAIRTSAGRASGSHGQRTSRRDA